MKEAKKWVDDRLVEAKTTKTTSPASNLLDSENSLAEPHEKDKAAPDANSAGTE